MDQSIDPSAFFSPSKARQQRAQAQEWAHVDAWLSSRYPPNKTPSFERNGDTLKALLTLVAANERADEEARMVADLEAEELEQMRNAETARQSEDMEIMEIMEKLEVNLTPSGAESLTAMAELAAVLPTTSTEAKALASAIVDLNTVAQDLETQYDKLKHTHARLEDELRRQRELLASISPNSTDVFRPPSKLPEQTAQYNRDTKILKSKLREYEDRLAGLPAQGMGGAGAMALKLAVREEEVKALEERVGALDIEVEKFEGLPNDREEARREVRRTLAELEGLKRRRDDMFAGMAR